MNSCYVVGGIEKPSCRLLLQTGKDQEKRVHIYLFQMRGNPIDSEYTGGLDQL